MNDSIYAPPQKPTASVGRVRTLALDDFVEMYGLVPSLIKIEGAEYDALLGSSSLIEHRRPVFILEQQTNDTRCLETLCSHNYLAVDLNSYREISSPNNFPSGVAPHNLLFIPREGLGLLPYPFPCHVESVGELVTADFCVQGGVTRSGEISVVPGCYLPDVRFSACGLQNELVCGVQCEGGVLFRYHAYSKLLAESYRDWVVDVQRPSTPVIYFEFLAGTWDETFRIEGASIKRIRGFFPRPISAQFPK